MGLRQKFDMITMMDRICDKNSAMWCFKHNKWYCKDGRSIPVSDLDNRHLINILHYIDNKGNHAIWGLAPLWEPILTEEKNRRGLK